MFQELITELECLLEYLELFKQVENFVDVQEVLHLIESKAHDLIVEYVE